MLRDHTLGLIAVGLVMVAWWAFVISIVWHFVAKFW